VLRRRHRGSDHGRTRTLGDVRSVMSWYPAATPSRPVVISKTLRASKGAFEDVGHRLRRLKERIGVGPAARLSRPEVQITLGGGYGTPQLRCGRDILIPLLDRRRPQDWLPPDS
jgi:hypothetical protein